MIDVGAAFRESRAVAAAVLLAVPAVTALAAQTADGLPMKAVSADQCTCPAAVPDTPRVERTVAAEGAAVAAMGRRICAEVTRLQKEASANDLEAAIVFAISQSDVRTPAVATALAQVGGCDYGRRNFATALARVRVALLGRKFARGTAALAGGSAFGQSAFSAPQVNVGGGSSNYGK